MDKSITLKLCSLTLVLILGVMACSKIDKLDDLEVVNYDAEFAIPLFQSKTTFRELLEDYDESAIVTADENDLITLNYKGDLTARTSDDIFSVVGDFDGIPFPILDTFIALPFNIPNSIELDFGILKSGTLQWGWQSEHEEPILVKVSIPNATLNGEVFQHFQNASGPVNLYISPEFDMTDYKLTPFNDSLYVRYEAFRLTSNFADTLTNFFVKFNNFQSSYVQGYLGNDIYEIDRDTILIDLFENWTRGDVYFVDPKIKMTVENSFGFPVRAKANVMQVLTVDDEILDLVSPYVDSINFNYPSLSEVGQTKLTYFDFDKDNSNIDVILGSGPVAVDYDLDAVPNPDMNTDIHGFMTDSSFFNVQVEVDLPIYGRASGFEVRDTFAVDFSTYEEVDHVEFKLIAENGVPLDVSTQVYFANSNGEVLDSLFIPMENILAAAAVNTDGDVTAIGEKTTLVEMDSDRFDGVRSARKLYLTTAFSTTDNGSKNVKVTIDQGVDIRMGMKLGVKK